MRGSWSTGGAVAPKTNKIKYICRNITGPEVFIKLRVPDVKTIGT
jgi:hypothetical protein